MSTTPDHDRDIERLLRQSLPGVTPATAACVDSEALAAWVDGGLDATTRLATEAHVADCPRCQAIVATLIQSAPPELVAVPWWRTALVRWLAPMALATAATTAWFLLPTPTPMSPEGLPAQARNDAPAFEAPSAPAAEDESALAKRAAPQEAPPSRFPGADAPDAAARSKQEVAARPAPPSAPPATIADRLGAERDVRQGPGAPTETGAVALAPPRPAPPVTQPSESTANALGQARREGREAERREGFAPVATNEQPQPAAKMAEAVAAAPQVAGGITAQAPPARNAPAAAPTAAPAPSAPPAFRAQAPGAAGEPQSAGTGASALGRSRLADAADAAGTRVVIVAAPTARDRWRIVGGRIERSTDAGVTWEGATVAGATDVISGASPAPGICWLVGRGGTILLTAEGSRWQRVSAPTDEDLVSVSATSATSAVVTTRAGRRYTTINAGTTWR